MKLYQYTILKQNGTFEKMKPCKKKKFEEFYKILNCNLIEIIPTDYYKGLNYGHCTMYADEEGRFNENNYTNPHFLTLADGYDVVGDIIKEEVYKGE